MSGVSTPAERSCQERAESGTKIGEKSTSGAGLAFWIFVTWGPNSVWPILNVSSPTISPPQIWAKASAKNVGMSFV